MAVEEGILDKITRQAGQNLQRAMDGMIASIDRAVTAGVGSLFGGDREPAAATERSTGILASIREMVTGGFGNDKEPAPQPQQAATPVIEPVKTKATAYDCDQNDIVCPVVPKAARTAEGIGF